MRSWAIEGASKKQAVTRKENYTEFTLWCGRIFEANYKTVGDLGDEKLEEKIPCTRENEKLKESKVYMEALQLFKKMADKGDFHLHL